MIKSCVLKVKNIKELDNSYIEYELSKFQSDIIRWAITDINDSQISVCISYNS